MIFKIPDVTFAVFCLLVLSSADCKHHCHHRITAHSDKIISFTDQNFNTGGKEQEYCVLEIKSRPHHLINVNLNYRPRLATAVVNCSTDYLRVGNDNSRIDHELMTSYKFCEELTQENIISRDNYLWIVLRTSNKSATFKIEARSQPKVRCKTDEFECSPIQCVSMDVLCDGIADCHNNRDEFCQKNFANNSCFHCFDGTCIRPVLPRYSEDWGKEMWYLCDEIQHCPDGTDERKDRLEVLLLMMEVLLVLCFCLAVYVNRGTCYMTGAPFGTCLTMYPHHGPAVHQTTETPFTITVDKATYQPDDELTVVIRSANDTIFRGLELKVHRLTGNQEILEGQFTQFNSTKLKTQNCFGGEKNLITHSNNNTVTSLTITWRAPSQNIGDIQFTATIVESFSVFWFNVKAAVQAVSADNIVNPVFQLPNIPAEFTPIDFNDCGQTKGCFYHPHTCSGDDCIMVVTYEDNDDGTYSFEMFGKSTNGAGYISTALSKDKTMGEDPAFVCSIETDNVAVRFAYNPRHYTVLDYTRGFTGVETRYENGNIFCRFTRNSNTTLYQGPNLNFDLSESYYLQMAYGGTYSNTGQAKKHKSAPVVTKDLVYLKDTNVLTINGPVSGAKTLRCIQLTIMVSLLFVWL